MYFSWKDQHHPINEWYDTLERAVIDAVEADYDPHTIKYLFRDEDGIRVITSTDHILDYEREEIVRQIRGV